VLGVTAGDHASLVPQVQAAEQSGRRPSYERHDRAAGGLQRFGCVHAGPLHASQAAVRGNVMAAWDRGADRVQHLSGGTALRGSTRHVLPLLRGGRARGKLAKEPCNPLKQHGDHVEHTYGHGPQTLSVGCAAMLLVAVLVDQTPQRCCAVFRAGWTQWGRQRLVWERMRALCYDYRLESRREVFAALWSGIEKPRPLVTIAPAETRSVSRSCRLQDLRLFICHGLLMPKSRELPLRKRTAELFCS
jgi:hypothetical protein